MRTAIISDEKLNWPAFSRILDSIRKAKIIIDPLVIIPDIEKDVNVVDYFSSLKQYGTEISNDPDSIVYVASKNKKHMDLVKSFYNKNKRILYIKVDAAGLKYPYYQ